MSENPQNALPHSIRKWRTVEMHRLSVEEYHAAKKMPVTVVLDDVRSMYNVGSVFRTADAFRVERILLCGITAQPPHPEIHKTALGAELSVPWEYYASADEAVANLLSTHYTLLAIEQADGSTPLQSYPWSENQNPVAIVLGNEVHGVRQTVIDHCHACLELPQFGTKHSLNVATTAGIVLWEAARHYLLSSAQPN